MTMHDATDDVARLSAELAALRAAVLTEAEWADQRTHHPVDRTIGELRLHAMRLRAAAGVGTAGPVNATDNVARRRLGGGTRKGGWISVLPTTGQAQFSRVGRDQWTLRRR